MAIQYILSSFPYPVFVNETVTSQYIIPTVFLNETSGGSPPAGGRSRLMKVGTIDPSAVDILLSGAMFAGLIVKENPVTPRRGLFTLGLGKTRG